MDDEVRVSYKPAVPRTDVRYGPLELPSNVDWKSAYLETHRHDYELGKDEMKAFSSHMSVDEFISLNSPIMPLDKYQIFEHHGRWFQYSNGVSETPVSSEFIDVVNNEITEPFDSQYDEDDDHLREQLLDAQVMFFQRSSDGKIYFYYNYNHDLNEARLLLGSLRKQDHYTDSQNNVIYFPKRLYSKTGTRITVASLAARIKKTNKSYDLVWFGDERLGHVTITK